MCETLRDQQAIAPVGLDSLGIALLWRAFPEGTSGLIQRENCPPNRFGQFQSIPVRSAIHFRSQGRLLEAAANARKEVLGSYLRSMVPPQPRFLMNLRPGRRFSCL
jgi:hypothetical protein